MWTKEWPTKPGHYWILGKLWGAETTEIQFMRCFLSANDKMVFVANGTFVYKKEVGDVVFQKAEMSDIPDGLALLNQRVTVTQREVNDE